MHSKYRYLLPLCVALVSIALPEDGSAQTTRDAKTKAAAKATESNLQFLRLDKQGDELKALQTAITRYQLKGDANTTVDLIGAVHIGEKTYFETLNELFKDYDVVLYELVAPEGTRIPKGGGNRKSSNPISFLQSSAQSFLGLESQLELVDYTVKNLRHADMSPTEMAEKMKERGQTTMSLVMSSLSEMMNDPETANKMTGGGGLSLGDLADMMSDPVKAKRFMAAQFGNAEQLGLGSGLNKLIVEDRNKAAMEVLDDVLKEGNKKVAIFYGAAHMPDFEQRLESRKFKYSTQSWLSAWDLTQSHSKKKQDSTMSLLMQLMKSLDQ